MCYFSKNRRHNGNLTEIAFEFRCKNRNFKKFLVIL
jgi:hypothetical protein